MQENKILIKIEDLHKDFILPRRHIFRKPSLVYAVQGISLVLEKEYIYGIVGESGCGKSTLARMIAGVETPTRGKIYFKGEEWLLG